MTLRPRDRLALALVAAVALTGAFYVVALRPERGKAHSLAAAISTQQQAILSAQQQVAAGRAAEASLKATTKELASVNLAVPAKADIPGLLRILQRTATAARVKMQTLGLSGASEAASGATSTTTSAPGASGTSAASPVAVQLTFAGRYSGIQDLLQRIDRFVVTSGSKVTATGPLLSVANVQLSGTGELTAQVSASIYQLSGSSSTSATATTGGNQ